MVIFIHRTVHMERLIPSIYILKKQFKMDFYEITFTEHAPLPTNFTDPTPDKDSGMDWKQLESYFHDLDRVENTI